MYTERVLNSVWREVEYFREENQEVLREGCKACVTHLTCVTNVMWTRQGLTHKHRCVCYAHKVCSTDVTHTQCILTLLCDAIFEMHTTCRAHHGHLLTANFDSEVKCCKFWMNQHRDLQKELQLFDDELTSKAEAFRDD